ATAGRRARQPRVREAAARLAEIGVPESIQHDDLHDGQVFVRDGGYRVIDWGDASVGHPFLTLVVTERVFRYGLHLDDAGIARLRDAYLEPFTVLAPRAAMESARPDVLLLGGIKRALAWARILGAAPESELVPYRDSAPGWLALALEGADASG